MGLLEGLMLRKYVDNKAFEQEESRNKAALFKSQADHAAAQGQLITLEVEKQKRYLKSFNPDLGIAGGGLSFPTGTGQGAPEAPGQQQSPALQSGTLPQQQPADEALGRESAEDALQSRALTAAKFGLNKEAHQLALAGLEIQKTRLAYRQQSMQDQLGNLIRETQYPLTTEQRTMNRIQQAALAAQLGKTNDAIQILDGKITALQPGGSLTQVFPGEAPKVLVKGMSPEDLAEKRGAGAQRGRFRVEEEPAGAPGPTLAPAPSAQGSGAEGPPDLVPQLIAAGMSPEAAAAAAPFVAKVFTPVETEPQPYQYPSRQALGAAGQPPIPITETRAQRATRLKEETRLRTQGLTPGNPQNPVVRQEAAARAGAQIIPKETTEAIGVPFGTDAEQVKKGEIIPEQPIPRQLPTGEERETLAKIETTLEAAQDLQKLIKEHPEHTELLGSFLVNPKGAAKRFLTRQGGGNATTEQRQFLADYGVTAATLRSRLIGLAQTSREFSGLVDFLPDVSTSKEQIAAALSSIIRETTRSRDVRLRNQKALGISTPGSRNSAPTGQAPAPTAAPKSIQDMTYEEKMREIEALREKKRKAGQR